MSATPSLRTDQTCDECGRFGAYAFDGGQWCVDCCQQRGSCCAERDCGGEPAEPAPVTLGVVPAPDETLRVNPNCCYAACPRCSSMRRLRQFQAAHPRDWRDRLRGLPRIVRLAQGRD